MERVGYGRGRIWKELDVGREIYGRKTRNMEGEDMEGVQC